MTEAALYLIPVQLSDVELDTVLPQSNIQIVREIKHFIVENVRSARRFLKKCDRSIDIDTLTFYELNRHTRIEDIPTMLTPLIGGEAMGIISEAGCPAIADPGADVVAIAQSRGLKVKPLVGPSSILMGLMGSGFNGQSFAFLGYLPIDAGQRTRKLKDMEQRIVREDQTQIFIETPYRNNALVAEICKVMPSHIKLCIATDITGAGERIITRGVKQWLNKLPDLNKVPTIFLLYK
ncbi:MAG: SAM-dependent methyltransferase [Muribaculaceae bacterium]|nr:SAM-dependent methyltransferase [Muribaculaceae bacterium]